MSDHRLPAEWLKTPDTYGLEFKQRLRGTDQQRYQLGKRESAAALGKPAFMLD
jgi:hypothetical protein